MSDRNNNPRTNGVELKKAPLTPNLFYSVEYTGWKKQPQIAEVGPISDAIQKLAEEKRKDKELPQEAEPISQGFHLSSLNEERREEVDFFESEASPEPQYINGVQVQ